MYFFLNISSDYQGFNNLEYVILLTIVLFKYILYLKHENNNFKYIQNKINGLKAQQIFNCY